MEGCWFVEMVMEFVEVVLLVGPDNQHVVKVPQSHNLGLHGNVTRACCVIAVCCFCCTLLESQRGLNVSAAPLRFK